MLTYSNLLNVSMRNGRSITHNQMSHVATHVQSTFSDEVLQPCDTNPQHPSKNCLQIYRPYGGNLLQGEKLFK